MFQWHKSLWQNGHTFWNTHLHDQVLGNLINGEIAPLIYKDIEVDLKKSQDYSVLPIVSGQSGIMLSMTREMAVVPLYSVESKRDQLKSLQHSLSDKIFDRQQILGFDNQVLKSSLREFVSKYLDTNLMEENIDYAQLKLQVSHLPENLMSDEIKSHLDLIFDGMPNLSDSPENDSNESRGKMWIAFGLVFLHTYIPDIPVDPVETRKAKLQFLSRSYDVKTAELLIKCESEYLAKGNFEMRNKHDLLNEISKLLQKEKKLQSKLPLRPQISQMTELFSDLQNLKNNILNSSKINELVDTLSSSSDIALAFQMESSLQKNLSSIIQRWENNYEFYLDLLQPVLTSIYQIKFGLRLLQSSAVTAQNHMIDENLNVLLKFTGPFEMNAIRNINSISMENTDSSSILKLNIRMAALERIIFHQQSISPQSSDLMDFVTEIFNSIAEDWEKQRIYVCKS